MDLGGAGVPGGTAIYAEGTGGWGTPLSGEAGTVTITSLSATRIAGAVSFSAATPPLTIANPIFDVGL